MNILLQNTELEGKLKVMLKAWLIGLMVIFMTGAVQTSVYAQGTSTVPQSSPLKAGAAAGNTQTYAGSGGIKCTLNGTAGVLTAIGCLPYDPVVLVNSLVTFLISAAGGIALLLMAASAIQMMTQGSDAKALQAAQQRFVGAASGLLFIIFSVLLLRIIGVNILQIPGFS